MSTKHRFQSAVADNGDPNELTPNKWNDSHKERCGQEILVAGTKAILFSALDPGFNGDEPDLKYSISLTGDADENFYWSAKATTGFTINSSNGGSTAHVDWKISRHA